jgi:hypothetical protein
LLVMLAACGGGGDLPDVRPQGSVGGTVAAGSFAEGSVAVYSFQSGARGERLGGADLSPDGRYAVTLRARSQPILVEASRGRYVEESSGVDVTLADGQAFTTLAWYESGASTEATVTPLTHVATGLALYKVAHGVPAWDAAVAAQREVSAAFNVNVASIAPRIVTQDGAKSNALADDTRYGFLLAALSSLSEWIGARNGTGPHRVYTSSGLSQIMFDDVNADGMLDGVGWNKDQTGLMNLAYGAVSLDADFYRMALAQHVLAMALSARNQTGLGFDNLLEPARDFAANRHALFGAQDPVPPPDAAPRIAAAQTAPQTAVQSGTIDFKVAIDGVIPADRVAFALDDVALGAALDPRQPQIVIDTTRYAEGEHLLRVSAVDALGNRATQDFALNFDNFFVTVTSPLLTNQAAYPLNGEYELNGGTLGSLVIQGKNAVVDAVGSWRATVDLAPGHNAVAIELVDTQGHSERYEVVIDLDLTPPAIDTSAGHGAAKFSSGGGNYTMGVLHDQNLGVALFRLANRAELDGTPIARADLDGNEIPYFALTVSDPLIDGVGSAPDRIKVRMTYERNGNVIAPTRELGRSGDEFLIPIASETLDPEWLNSNPSDQHSIRVEAVDAAGNTQQLDLTFRVDFHVTAPNLEPVADLGDDLFVATPFDRRADLNNRQFAATAYAFTNTSGKSFNVYLADAAQHQAEGIYEKMVREHQVRTKTTTEWRVGQIDNALITNQCPQSGAWVSVTSLLNYNQANGWESRTVPQPTHGAAFSVFSDIVPTPQPATTGWTNVPDFDGDYFPKEEFVPSGRLTFEYDYIVDAAQFSRPAAIRNWRVVDSDEESHDKSCPDVKFFQQQFAYANESVSGYPKNTKTQEVEQLNFATTGFEVFDDDDASVIAAVGGWYAIPAGHHVTIRKRVTTPVLTIHNDGDVADPATFSSYTPHSYDKTFSWTVDRGVILSLAHDAGSDNLLKMSARDVAVDAGKHVYTLQR